MKKNSKRKISTELSVLKKFMENLLNDPDGCSKRILNQLSGLNGNTVKAQDVATYMLTMPETIQSGKPFYVLVCDKLIESTQKFKDAG